MTAQGQGAPVVELRDASKAFRRRTLRSESRVAAVDSVSLRVHPGEVVALVGESGAGKSTVGRLILGLVTPDSGSVSVGGSDLSSLGRRDLRAVRRSMHLVLQDPYQSLHPGMRVDQVVAEPLAISRVRSAERARRVARAVEEVGLTPADRFLARFPHQLSGGQRQRVAIARAIVGRPTVVVADEPTSMLDASLCAGVLDLLLGIRERYGTAIVYITHDLAVARHVSDRIVVMQAGRVVEEAQADTLVCAPQTDYSRLLIAASQGRLDDLTGEKENHPWAPPTATTE